MSKELRHARKPNVGTWEVFTLPSALVPGSQWVGRYPKTLVNEVKKSDAGIVPMKVANKGASALAELLEGRAAAKANLTAKARAGLRTR